MRCSCCNRALSDYESTLRHAITQEYLDTCTKCLEGLDIPSVGNPELSKFDLEDIVEESFDEDEDI